MTWTNMTLQYLTSQLDAIFRPAVTGSVVRTEGGATVVSGFPAPVGALVEIERQSGGPVTGEVIGFREELTLVCPLGDMTDVHRGNRVRLSRTPRVVRVGEGLMGRVINGNGLPVDGKPEPPLTDRITVNRFEPPELDRPAVQTPMSTGVRAIDALLPCGRGQRMGVFSGAGVGKSALLCMLARHSEADVNVIALIGRKGDDVTRLIDRKLGPDGLRKSVVVVANKDEPSLLRVEAAVIATAVAEYFRDRGKNVLLLMDSLTRFARAQREVGEAAGETPATRGYPPSLLASLTTLLERAGSNERGSITAFYSVLVENDDIDEPISNAARSLLDGHIVLSRKLASAGIHPAIELLESVSRLAPDIVPADQLDAIAKIRRLLAVFRDHEREILSGAYRTGSEPTVDAAIFLRDAIHRHLRQNLDEAAGRASAREMLLDLARQATRQVPLAS
jgi:FliI/YscN family ATPase